MSTLVILIGNIGTGKTTFCNNLKCKDRIIIRPDEIDDNFEFLQREKIIKSALQSHKWVIVDAPNM